MNDLFLKSFEAQTKYMNSIYELDQILFFKASNEIINSAKLDNCIFTLKKRLKINILKWNRNTKNSSLFNKRNSSELAFSIAFDIIDSLDKRFITGYTQSF